MRVGEDRGGGWGHEVGRCENGNTWSLHYVAHMHESCHTMQLSCRMRAHQNRLNSSVKVHRENELVYF